MTLQNPLQIFTSVSVGMGYNTAYEIAHYINTHTKSRYFPLANAGGVTDIIAQEQAAKEFNLVPIYARTILVGANGDCHLVVLAKDNAARTWMNGLPERFMSTNDAKEALLSSGANTTLFIPGAWVDDKLLFSTLGVLAQHCDVVLLWDVRSKVKQKLCMLTGFNVIPSLPISYTTTGEREAFFQLREMKTPPDTDQPSTCFNAGDSFYPEDQYVALFGRNISDLPPPARTLESIFSTCQTTPLTLEGSTGNDAKQNAALKDLCKPALEAFLATHTMAPADASRYRQRLDRELNLISELGLASDFLYTIELCELRSDALMMVRGRENNCLIFHLFGASLVDPVKHHLAEDLFYSKMDIELSMRPSFDFDGSAGLRSQLDQALFERYGECYTGVMHHSQVSTITAFRKIKDHPLYNITDALKRDIGRITKELPFFSENATSEQLIAHQPSAARFFANYPWTQSVFDSLVGRTRGVGYHISQRMIFKTNPAFIAPSYTPPENTHEGAQAFLGVPMAHSTVLPGFRFNLLGLNACTWLHAATTNPHVPIASLSDIPLNDADVIQAMRTCKTGLFQLDSDYVWAEFNKANISSIDDIAALLALCRPGPVELGLLEYFVNTTPYPLPETMAKNEFVLSTLHDTRGVPVFQEQFFYIMTGYAGLSESRAAYWVNHCAKLKKPEGVEHFVTDLTSARLGQNEAEQLAAFLAKTMVVGFAKGHALGYATLCYMLGWLRHYHLNDWFFEVVNYLISKGLTTEKRQLLISLLDLGVDVRGIEPDKVKHISKMIVSNGGWYPCYSEEKLSHSMLIN